LEGFGFGAHVVENSAEAMKLVQSLITEGKSFNNAGSVTLHQIGYTEWAINQKTGRNLHAEILAETDPVKQGALRRQGFLCDYFFTSASAVSETGEIIVADLTGTRVAPLFNSANNVVFIIGSNKIAKTEAEALRRLHEYVVPLESARVRVVYKVPESRANNIVTIRGSNPWGAPKRIQVIIIKENLGY